MSLRFSSKMLLVLAGFAGIFFVSSSASALSCGIPTNGGREYEFTNENCQIPSAILTVKRTMATGSYYNDFLTLDTTPDLLFTPSESQRRGYDEAFTGLIKVLWFEQGKNTPSKLSAILKSLSTQMRAKFTDTSLSNEERNKFRYLYFLSAETSDNLKGVVSTPSNPTTPSSEGLTFLQQYTALNGRSYGLWSSTVFYLFSRENSDNVIVERRARSLGDLINYIEYQNRIIHTAPNNRRYGVRKYNTIFKVNRDNGSLLNYDFNSPAAAINMLETCAVNTRVPYQYHAMCGFDTYGR